MAVPAGKSKVAAALLAFFLGQLGIHRFYLNQPGMGIGLIVMSIIGYTTAAFVVGWFFLVAVWIICLIDFITYLTMSDAAWAAKYPA
jgi:TM2 domain-containing membrane protein YozV